jgi:hypothetical protein
MVGASRVVAVAVVLAALQAMPATARTLTVPGYGSQIELDGTFAYFHGSVSGRSAVKRLDLRTGRVRTVLTVHGRDTFVHTIRAGGGRVAVGTYGDGEPPSEPGLLSGHRSRVFVASPGRRARVLARGATANDGEQCGSAVALRDVTADGAVLVEATRAECPGVEGRPLETRLLSYRQGTRRELFRRRAADFFEFVNFEDDQRTEHVGTSVLTWGPRFLRVVDLASGARRAMDWPIGKSRSLLDASLDPAGNLVTTEYTGGTRRTVRVSIRAIAAGDPGSGVIQPLDQTTFGVRFCGSHLVEWRITRTAVATFVRRRPGGAARRLATHATPPGYLFDYVCDGARAGVVLWPGEDDSKRPSMISWTRLK